MINGTEFNVNDKDTQIFFEKSNDFENNANNN